MEVRAVSDPVATPASQLSRWLRWKRVNLRLCNAASQDQASASEPDIFFDFGFKLGNTMGWAPGQADLPAA